MRGYSVNQIAKMVDRAPNTIINWESGKVSPDIDIVEKLCTIYNIRPNEMFGWEPCKELEEFTIKKQEILIEIEKLQKEKADIELRLKKYHKMLNQK